MSRHRADAAVLALIGKRGPMPQAQGIFIRQAPPAAVPHERVML